MTMIPILATINTIKRLVSLADEEFDLTSRIDNVNLMATWVEEDHFLTIKGVGESFAMFHILWVESSEVVPSTISKDLFSHNTLRKTRQHKAV